jgi:hypothetical protein
MKTVTIPLRIFSEQNRRDHWTSRAKRMRSHKRACIMIPHHSVPCVVTMTRLAPRMLDSDGNVAGFKAVRDAIADRLGVNDNDPRVEWRYAQEKAKDYAVRIDIDHASSPQAVAQSRISG